VQVEEGLAMATVVVESGEPPPLVTATVVEEGRTVTEMTAPKAALEPPAGTGPGSADVVMVPTDDDLVPPLPAGEHDAATSMVPESSPAAGSASVEGVADLASCRYVDFPVIRIIDLDTPELPSNDREMLEVAMERMFTDPLISDTIASVTSALRQDEGAGGSTPPAASEAAVEVLEESTTGTESVVDVSPPSLNREGTSASLPQPAETNAAAPTASVVDVVEGVVGGAGPSSPWPVVAATEEDLVTSQPAAAPQERVAPEGTTRAASPEIQEAEEGSGIALSQGAASGGAQALELACTSWVAAFEVGDDTEDDEEAAVCNTLECGLAWVCRAFDELILPATSVSFLT
jgi:hypothetical protein